MEVTARGQLAQEKKFASLQEDIKSIQEVSDFSYSDNSTFSNYSEGQLSHCDIIAIAGHLIRNNIILQKIMAQKYPYIFVDEAQDTFTEIVMALNTLCSGKRPACCWIFW